MKRFYWLYAEPTPEEIEKQKKEKEAKEKLEKEQKEKEEALVKLIEKQLSDKYDGIINGYKDEIAKLKEDLEKSKNDPNKDKQIINNEEILKNLQETNKLFVQNKKTELIKKYNIKEEDLSGYDTVESLNELDKVYDKAFNKAKETYTSEEKIVEELKKRKKMVVDLDDGLGEKAQKQTQDKRTKGIINFLSRK